MLMLDFLSSKERSMKFVPSKGRVVVKLSDVADKIGVILLPDGAKEKPRTGKVIAVNPSESNYTEGSTVFFNNYYGTPINLGGTEYFVFKEEDIYGIIQGE